ncbi:MAG: dienelactone hydrolase family protein [Chitinophagaceae bacterium]
MKQLLTVFSLGACIALASCGNNAGTQEAETAKDTAHVTAHTLKTEEVSYPEDTTTAKSYIAYEEGHTGKLPVVIVIPEWWGLNGYAKRRARELAGLGYFAIAVDLYGNGKVADNPADAKAFATPFIRIRRLALGRIQAALAKAFSYEAADSSRTAAIGYCFGGSMVLNAARLGQPFKGVVSFHGGMAGVPASPKLTARVLVLHGGADKFVSEAEVAGFRKQMDSVKANYIFKEYPGATHAFTNPDATETGEKFNMPISYNGAADTASWQEMKRFLGEVLQ